MTGLHKVVAKTLVGTLTLCALLLLASPVDAAEEPMVVSYLKKGKLPAGERALKSHLTEHPQGGEARFGLGVLQILRSVENLGQSETLGRPTCPPPFNNVGKEIPSPIKIATAFHRRSQGSSTRKFKSPVSPELAFFDRLLEELAGLLKQPFVCQRTGHLML